MSTILYLLAVIGVSILVSALAAIWTRFFMFLIGNPKVNEMDELEVYNGNILSWYGHWVVTKFNHYERLKELKNHKLQANTKLNWFKALGACSYCNNVYWTIFAALVFIFNGLPWWSLFFIMSLSHFFLGLIYDYEDRQ